MELSIRRGALRLPRPIKRIKEASKTGVIHLPRTAIIKCSFMHVAKQIMQKRKLKTPKGNPGKIYSIPPWATVMHRGTIPKDPRRERVKRGSVKRATDPASAKKAL